VIAAVATGLLALRGAGAQLSASRPTPAE
jgi:hypothetical protein